MKKNLLITIYSGLTLLLCSCSKKGSTTDQTIPPATSITGREIEYGSGLPIADVNFHYALCSSASCSGSGVTNADGLITVPESSIMSLPSGTYSFSKNEYWTNK